MVEKEDVQFYGTVLGALASFAAVSYIAWQHKNNQAAFVKQDVMLQSHAAEEKLLNSVDGRLRNIELVQCSNPYVRQNPQLMRILNCPPSAPAAAHVIRQPPPPPTAQAAYVGRAPYGYSGPEPTSHLMLPNYGFFGDGPAGTASGALDPSTGYDNMMSTFAANQVVPFGGFGGGAPVPFEK
jgi:hypothetical protein